MREQGVNGHVEMAAAFALAGFEAVDVHMSDLAAGRQQLDAFQGLVACGGFSYGDVLGAGRGWAKSILFNHALRDAFQRFFRPPRSLCAGCVQRLPGAVGPARDYSRHRRTGRICAQPFRAVRGAPEPGGDRRIAIVVFCRACTAAVCRWPPRTAKGGHCFSRARATSRRAVALRYVDARRYAGRSSIRKILTVHRKALPACVIEDGRITIMMPHPERTLRAVNFSWAPGDWQGAFAVDAHVPQCPQLGSRRMSETSRSENSPNHVSYAPGRADDPVVSVDAVRLHALVLPSAFLHGVPVRMALDGLLRLVLGEQFYNVIRQPGPRLPVPGANPHPVHLPRRLYASRWVLSSTRWSYGYGLPLLFGLVMATEQRLLHKLVVLLVGYLVIMPGADCGAFLGMP